MKRIFFSIFFLMIVHSIHGQTEQKTNVCISLKGPTKLCLYRGVVFTITIRNDGDVSARKFRLVNFLPSCLCYIRSTPRGIFRKGRRTYSASGEICHRYETITWRIPEIKPHSKIIFKVMVRSTISASSVNIVRLIGRNFEGVVTSNYEAFARFGIYGPPAIHISSYDTEDPCEVGRKTIYIVDCRQEGTSPITNLQIKNRIPKKMQYIEAQGPTAHKYENGLVTFEPVRILLPGEKLTYKFVCKAISEGTAVNHTILNYDQFSPIIEEERTSIYKPGE